MEIPKISHRMFEIQLTQEISHLQWQIIKNVQYKRSILSSSPSSCFWDILWLLTFLITVVAGSLSTISILAHRTNHFKADWGFPRKNLSSVVLRRPVHEIHASNGERMCTSTLLRSWKVVITRKVYRSGNQTALYCVA